MQSQIEFCRREYQKQKKLEKIVNSRVLVRPKIKKWQVTASLVALPFLLLSAVLLLIFPQIDILYRIILFIFVILLIVEIYVRFILILAVKRYQAVAKEETRRRCKCIPSCSEYAIITLKKIFPLLLALLKIRKRLYKTCNGEEYKIDFPIKKMEKDFENSLQ